MTTTTCMQACPVVHSARPDVHWPAFSTWKGLAALGAWVSSRVGARYASWRETQALSQMEAYQLHDIGAPLWLHQRAQSRRAADCYEHFKAVSRLKY